MNPTHLTKRLHATVLIAGLLAGATALAACSGSANSASTGASTTGTGAGVVLPVADNPIVNTSTVEALSIDSVLVENNVDAAGNATDDHLEIALTNTSTAELSGFEIFYTFTDPTTNVTENYYVRLPDDFTISAGGQRVVHFDQSRASDHFAVNDFSLYYTDTNALDVTVTVSAVDSALQTATVHKDAGGAETAD